MKFFRTLSAACGVPVPTGAVRRVRTRVAASAMLVVALLGASTACAAPSAPPDASEGPEGELTLTVAQAVAQVNNGPVYLAQTLGYYEEEGVDVTILDATGANTTTIVASGQADLGDLGPGGPLLMTKQGRPTTIVYQQLDAGAAAYLFAKPDTTSIDELKGARFGTFSVGSGTYGFAYQFNESQSLGLELVPFQASSAISAAIVSGQVAAGNGNFTDFANEIAAGELHLLIDPNDPAQREKYVGREYPAGVTFGLVDTVAQKADAVTAFLRARNRALEWMQSATPEEVATELRKSTVYAAYEQDALEVAVERGMVFVSPNQGRIDDDTWEYALTKYANWGLDGFDPSDPMYAYDQRVDMSFLDAVLEE